LLPLISLLHLLLCWRLLPMMWRKENLWNFSVLQRVNLSVL
jgi:hypothetical protein